MISCKLQGGLGNYMFQVAAMYSLSNNVGFDIDHSAQVHKHIKTYLTNIFRKINTKIDNLQYEYTEPEYSYNPLPKNDNVLFNCYFQSEKYLDRNKVLDLYSIDDNSSMYINDKYGDILLNSVSIHVRRGDYVVKQDRHPLQDMNYYNSAIKLFNSCDYFLVFSDDIEWCKQNFIGDKFVFIEGEQDYIDLWMMSLCNHNIIANSSFSWWGAWLNKNPNKIVVAPKQWYGLNKKLDTKDLIPNDWTII
jgi:hypothetical protein